MRVSKGEMEKERGGGGESERMNKLVRETEREMFHLFVIFISACVQNPSRAV